MRLYVSLAKYWIHRIIPDTVTIMLPHAQRCKRNEWQTIWMTRNVAIVTGRLEKIIVKALSCNGSISGSREGKLTTPIPSQDFPWIQPQTWTLLCSPLLNRYFLCLLLDLHPLAGGLWLYERPNSQIHDKVKPSAIDVSQAQRFEGLHRPQRQRLQADHKIEPRLQSLWHKKSDCCYQAMVLERDIAQSIVVIPGLAASFLITAVIQRCQVISCRLS